MLNGIHYIIVFWRDISIIYLLYIYIYHDTLIKYTLIADHFLLLVDKVLNIPMVQ